VSNIDAAHSNQLLAWSFALSATAPVSPIHVRLMTAMGTATSNGTELATGGSPGYTSGTGAPTSAWAAPSGQSIATSAGITLTGMPAVPSPGIAGIELWDSAGTPKRTWFGALTGGSKIVNAGDTFSFAVAGITSGIS
jgi:hypothetical protein